MKKILNNKHNLFIICLIIISLYYNYPNIAFKRPQSIHKWRQTDCLSITLNYSQNGMHFLFPETNGFLSDNGKSGYAATSEIPLFYYFIAILYKIFGYHDFIYRIINTIIFFLGLFYLFKLSYYILNDVFLSNIIALLFFASPVLAYYGNNFLTDTTSLSLAIIAFYYFYLFIKNRNNFKSYYVSILFFLLAGSCKISSLLCFVAIIAILILELFEITNIGLKKIILSNLIKVLTPLFLLFISISSWVFYAKHYNYIHNTGYFSTTILPYWDLSQLQIKEVFNSISNLWLNHYFHFSTLIILGLMSFFNLIFFRSNEKFLYLIHLFIFLGSILYSLLWFSTFMFHDYYLINIYFLPIISIILFFSNIKQLYPQILTKSYFKIAFILFLLFNIKHTNKILDIRYSGWQSDPTFHSFHNITPYLHSIGIKNQDTVICLPDDTHASLYNMNLKGWTNCMNSTNDSIKFVNHIDNGAKYLIINGDISKEFPFIKQYMNSHIGEFQNINIYKLKD